MPLSTVLITIVAAGVLLWLVNRFSPMQGQIKSILNGLVVIVLFCGSQISMVCSSTSINSASGVDIIPHRRLYRLCPPTQATTQYSSPLTAGDLVKHTLLFVIGSALSLSAFAHAIPQDSIALVSLAKCPRLA